MDLLQHFIHDLGHYQSVTKRHNVRFLLVLLETFSDCFCFITESLASPWIVSMIRWRKGEL